MKAKITFSNGTTIVIEEDQYIIPVIKYERNSKINVSKNEPYQVWNHISDGLIPSITEFLCNCEYFELLNNSNKIYNSKAVVSIENI